jgi:hypothetical protein
MFRSVRCTMMLEPASGGSSHHFTRTRTNLDHHEKKMYDAAEGGLLNFNFCILCNLMS